MKRESKPEILGDSERYAPLQQISLLFTHGDALYLQIGYQ